MKERTVCFTGHRNIPAGQYDTVYHRLKDVFAGAIGRGYRYFGAGSALGFDTMAAQAVLELKRTYPFIRLILVLPCPSQASRWKEQEQKVYERIKSQADKVVYTSQRYTKDCMYRRNRHLVHCSSMCISYQARSTGGTAYTVRYARKRGLAVINIAQEMGCNTILK